MGVLRVYLEDNVVLRQLGLHNTFKTFPVDEKATVDVVHQKMIKQMSRGMSPAQVQVIEEQCAEYQLVEVFDGNSRPLGPEQVPLALLQENQKIMFYFRPPQEVKGGAAEGGEALVKDEVLSSYQPVNVWGFTSPFAGRHKTGIATLDDMINFIKHRKEAEVQLMKGLQKGMKKVTANEKGTTGKAWSGVKAQQNQIVFLHQQMSDTLDLKILKALEALKSHLDHDKSKLYKKLSEDEKALKTLMDRSNRLKKKYHQCSEQQETDQINYIKAKNDPMTEPKSLAESSQAAEKSKKISEDARKEYQNHLEKAKEEHPMLIKKIQDCYKELQRLEWERLSSVAMVLEIVVENHEKFFSDLHASNKQMVAMVQGINPESDIQNFKERNRTDLSPDPDAVFEEWDPSSSSTSDGHSISAPSIHNIFKKKPKTEGEKKEKEPKPEKDKEAKESKPSIGIFGKKKEKDKDKDKEKDKEKEKKEKDKKEKEKKDKKDKKKGVPPSPGAPPGKEMKRNNSGLKASPSRQSPNPARMSMLPVGADLAQVQLKATCLRSVSSTNVHNGGGNSPTMGEPKSSPFRSGPNRLSGSPSPHSGSAPPPKITTAATMQPSSSPSRFSQGSLTPAPNLPSRLSNSQNLNLPPPPNPSPPSGGGSAIGTPKGMSSATRGPPPKIAPRSSLPPAITTLPPPPSTSPSPTPPDISLPPPVAPLPGAGGAGVGVGDGPPPPKPLPRRGGRGQRGALPAPGTGGRGGLPVPPAGRGRGGSGIGPRVPPPPPES